MRTISLVTLTILTAMIFFAGSVFAAAPTLTTGTASSVTTTTATLAGEATADGGENISATGFQYGLTGSYGSTASTSVSINFDHNYLSQWGSSGSGNGQFGATLNYVAVDSLGNVYVADYGNYRVQKFDSDGTYITQWGSSGSGNGQFNRPIGIAIDSADNVYVTDNGNYRVQKFDSDGTYITQWGSSGSGNGQFNQPWGIAIDSSDNVYVVDFGNHRVQKFDSDGTYITKWGSIGSGNGQFTLPRNAAIDSSDNIYVIGAINNRVQKFDSDGTYITQWGSSGSGNGQFNGGYDIAIDSSDNVFTVEVLGDRVQKFDSDGTYITQWGTTGTGNGEFDSPTGVAVNSSDEIYVVDRNNYRVQTFSDIDASGAFTESLTGLTCGSTYHYRAFATNTDGTSYGSDSTFTTSTCPVTGSISTGGIHYSCRDEAASNYERFGRHKESLCEYAGFSSMMPYQVEQTNTTEQIQEALQVVIPERECPFFSVYAQHGDKGPEVKLIQTFLQNQGINPGPLDSHYGPLTHNAIKQFQTKYFDAILKPWNLTEATGRWYQSTRNQANELAGCDEGKVTLDNGVVID